MNDSDSLKQQAAQAAVSMIEDDSVVGVGTGSTVGFFITELAKIKGRIEGAVASSETTAELLREAKIPVLDLNHFDSIPI